MGSKVARNHSQRISFSDLCTAGLFNFLIVPEHSHFEILDLTCLKLWKHFYVETRLLERFFSPTEDPHLEGGGVGKWISSCINVGNKVRLKYNFLLVRQ